MIGNDAANPVFPVMLAGNQLQYGFDASTQLQLYGNSPGGCGVDPMNYMVNGQVYAGNRPVKRARETEDSFRMQKQQMCLNRNNFYQDENNRSMNFIVKQNPVSTGLKLSCDDDEHKSSVTSASGSTVQNLPAIFSLGENMRSEIDRQTVEFDRYIRVQEEQLSKGIRELKQRQTVSFLSALEKGVGKKLMEKEIELQNMITRNKTLVEKIKQVTTEVHSWHYKAKYSENTANVLKSNLNMVIAQRAEQGKEGWGDSEIEGAASSYVDQNNHVNICKTVKPVSTNNHVLIEQKMTCKVCKSNEVSVLLMPCRHLCLCKDCERSVDLCPVCNSEKNTSFQVYLS
ncbi:hypothetical protein MKW94_007464 [Papaver nudicaule]|uniref:RING-type domain-containing protein n=1 Tax=Papaver nudicaule TaxID=74823 RepID=A0AA42B4M6_PAPNU|nr:hypothetical protein [Papaver nudicaule]